MGRDPFANGIASVMLGVEDGMLALAGLIRSGVVALVGEVALVELFRPSESGSVPFIAGADSRGLPRGAPRPVPLTDTDSR